MPIRLKILSEIRRIATDQGKTLKHPSDNLVLAESGLDSFCFAILVTRLEDEFGFDPFTMSEDVYFPVTLGDFVRFYEDAFGRLQRHAVPA